MAHADDGIRAVTGLLVSVTRRDGTVRLVIDRARRTNGSWEQQEMSTFRDFDETVFRSLGLSEEELSGLGVFLLAELVAQLERGDDI